MGSSAVSIKNKYKHYTDVVMAWSKGRGHSKREKKHMRNVKTYEQFKHSINSWKNDHRIDFEKLLIREIIEKEKLWNLGARTKDADNISKPLPKQYIYSSQRNAAFANYSTLSIHNCKSSLTMQDNLG